jgi:hypothetical protein
MCAFVSNSHPMLVFQRNIMPIKFKVLLKVLMKNLGIATTNIKWKLFGETDSFSVKADYYTLPIDSYLLIISAFLHFSDIWGSLTQSFLYNNLVCFESLLAESSKEMQ